jgi:hypothetical protein
VLFVDPSEPAVFDDIGRQDRDKLAGLAHQRAQPPSTLCRLAFRSDGSFAAAHQTLEQGLRLSDFRHFRRRRKAFERRREDRLSVSGAVGRLVKLG